MRFGRGFDDVLASRGHLRVLRALDALPAGLAVSVRDLARRAGVAHPRASEILTGLTELGLTTVQRAGRADLYQLNREHVLFPPIHALFVEEAHVVDDLKQELAARLRRISDVQEAYLFGSVARGDGRADSDIDVALVVPKGRRERAEAAVEEVSREIRERFGNEVNFHVGTVPLKAREHTRTGRDVWQRIAAEGTPIVRRRG